MHTHIHYGWRVVSIIILHSIPHSFSHFPFSLKNVLLILFLHYFYNFFFYTFFFTELGICPICAHLIFWCYVVSVRPAPWLLFPMAPSPVSISCWGGGVLSPPQSWGRRLTQGHCLIPSWELLGYTYGLSYR